MNAAQKSRLMLLFFTGFFIPVLHLYGQYLRPEELNIRQGLSQGYIADVLQDREGFIWVGTKNGLNRYDGRRFKVFSVNVDNPWSLSHDFVSALWEHGDFLLAGTNGGGLNIFHKKTQRFFRLPDKPPGGGALETPAVMRVAVDAVGNIWLLSWETYLEGKLYRIQMPEGFWKRFAERGQPDWTGVSIQKISDKHLDRFYMMRSGKRLYYYIYGGELMEVDVHTGSQKPLVKSRSDGVSGMGEDAEGRLWLAYKNELSIYDGTQWASLSTDFPIQFLHHLSADNLLLIHTKPTGLLCFDLNKPITRLRRDEAVFVINNVFVHNAIFDQSGNVWFGTNGHGLYRANPRLTRFRIFFAGRSVYSRPFATSDGVFGYFDDSHGMTFSQPDSRHALVVSRSRLPGIGSHGRYIKGSDGVHWLLLIENFVSTKLLRLAPDGSSYKIFLIPEIELRPGNIAIDAQGAIWIGLNGRFYRFNPETEQFTTFDYRTVLPFGHEVRAFAQTPDGKWWIGTSNGLVEAKTEGNGFRFSLWKNNPTDVNSLRNDDISCILPDPEDPYLLWIGTKGGGLNRLDVRSGQFFHLTTKNGLPNDVVYGIVPDDEGFLWMSTNKGLVRYHPATGVLKHFTEDDGLQADEFNTWAYGKSPAGELIFGGVNGMNVFDPKAFADNPVLPKVYFTALKINNREVLPGDSTGLLRYAIGFTDKIRLPFHQNSITLEFAALEYTAPSKNQFRYYLEGAEPEWAHESSEPSAQYLNLAPGTYTFKVKACNNDGLWSDSPASLRVVVLPPWYRSWWAYALYCCMVLSLIFGYVRFRLRQLRLEQKLAMKHREAERIRELDQFKTKLYTNITHEFRTPLTVILGTSEQLAVGRGSTGDGEEEVCFPKSKFQQQIGLIKRNGRNLLDLVNQLLDLAKAENNQLHTNMVQGDLLQYVRYITESFHSLANHANILLRVESRSPAIVMDYDPEKIRQILSNLIANALKFTASGGEVRVSLNLDERPDNHVLLQVTDTGSGIPEKDQPHVFDRFYQVDNAATQAGGSGIGLSLAKELVKLLGGDIQVESVYGKGSTFSVVLPVNHTGEQAPVALPPIEANAALEILKEPPAVVSDVTKTYSILIVEDNPDVVAHLRFCLQDVYHLYFAYNGRAGIEIAFEQNPDLIVSDVMMPEKNGLEVCDTLKNDERSSHIPIVLLTAKADIESRIAGLRRGADAYIAKPFHPEVLSVTLEKLIENRRKLQQRYSSVSLSAPVAPGSTDTVDLATEIEDAFLQKLRLAIEERLHNANLSSEEIGRAIGMGRSNLYAKLSALTGLSFNVYVRTLRLHKAKHLLETTTANVSETAYAVGFNDPKYFSRVFAAQFGMTPSEVRR